jgi:hypothetical protein
MNLTPEADNTIIVLLISKFMTNGNLPPGIHRASMAQAKLRFARTYHRKELFRGFRNLAIHLKEANCQTLYLDGSFVTSKEQPDDYDAVWDPVGVTNKIDPVLLTRDKIEERKKKYFGDVFVHLPDSGGFPHLEYFQRDRDDYSDKGIIKIDLRQAI